jgi:rRNA maturation endonuclease Nob1
VTIYTLLRWIVFVAFLVAVVMYSYNFRRCERCGGRWTLRKTGEAKDLTYNSLSEWMEAGFFDQEAEFRCKKCGGVVWRKTFKP